MSDSDPIRLDAPTLGGRLRQAREARKLTQTVVAARLGVKPPRVVEWEQDQHVPKPPTLRSLAGIYAVTVDQLAPPAPAPRGRPAHANGGAAVTIPHDDALKWRDEALRWRGRLEVMMEWQSASQRTTQALYDDLGRSITRLAEFLSSGVLPQTGTYPPGWHLPELREPSPEEEAEAERLADEAAQQKAPAAQEKGGRRPT
jgi:transcriptional regulator with XRE-family HTH domain